MHPRAMYCVNTFWEEFRVRSHVGESRRSQQRNCTRASWAMAARRLGYRWFGRPQPFFHHSSSIVISTPWSVVSTGTCKERATGHSETSSVRSECGAERDSIASVGKTTPGGGIFRSLRSVRTVPPTWVEARRPRSPIPIHSGLHYRFDGNPPRLLSTGNTNALVHG
jgi:hypothetical protein